MAYRQTVATLLKLLPLFILLIPQVACSQNREPAAAAQKGGGMEAARNIQTDLHSIPPIDLKAPAEFATATFGLG